MGKREENAAQKALRQKLETLHFLSRYRGSANAGFEYSPRCAECMWYLHATRGSTRVPHRKGKAYSQKHFCCMGPALMRLDGRSVRKTMPANCPRYLVEASYRVYRPKDLSKIPDISVVLDGDPLFTWSSDEYRAIMKERDNAPLYWRITKYQRFKEKKEKPHHKIPNYSSGIPLLEAGMLVTNDGPAFQLEERDIIIRQDGLTINRWEVIKGKLMYLSYFREAGIEDLPKE